MLISDIRVYKTPLDSEYKNVYDSYATKQEYSDFLKNNFDYIDVMPNTTGTKSVKDVDGDFEVVVNGYSSEDLHDYNYMRFHTKGTGITYAKYAFITKIESVNDNPTVQTETKTMSACKLTCKYDVWSNHYLEIKNSYNKIKENKCTYDFETLKNYSVELKNKKFLENISVKAMLPRGDNIRLYPYLPIWQRIIVVESVEVTNSLFHYSVTDSNNINKYMTFYALAGVISQDAFGRLHYFEGTKTLHFKGIDSTSATYRDVTESFDAMIKLSDIKSSAVVSNTLTANVPFYYTVQHGTGSCDVTISDTNIFDFGYRIKTVKSHSVDWSSSLEQLTIVDEPLVNAHYFIHSNIYGYDFNGRIYLPTHTAITYNSNKRYSTIQPYADIEGIFTEYPFNYHSIYANGRINRLYGMPYSDFVSFYYDCRKRVIANISNFEPGNDIECISLENDTALPILEIPIDEYLARNGSALDMKGKAALFSGLVSLAATVATGNPIPLAAGTAGMAIAAGNIDSALSDKENSPTNMRQFGINALSQNVPQDTAIILNHSIETNVANEILKDCHINGYDCYMENEIFDIRRDVFDIDRGELTESFAISNDDKEKLKNALRNGITRWHIFDNYSETSERRNTILSGMNKNVTNYPASIIPSP